MSDPYSAKELLNLESAFILKVYNHSGSTMDFKISNDQCMYLSGNTSITVPAFSWGEFEAPLQISYNVLNACAVSQSRFNITAFRACPANVARVRKSVKWEDGTRLSDRPE